MLLWHLYADDAIPVPEKEDMLGMAANASVEVCGQSKWV